MSVSGSRVTGRPTPVALCPPRRRLPCSQAQQRHRGEYSRLAGRRPAIPTSGQLAAPWARATLPLPGVANPARTGWLPGRNREVPPRG